MFRIVQTIWIDQLRARDIRKEDGDIAEDRLGSDEPVRRVEARLALSEVRRAVSLLPPDQRATLMLVTVEGLSYKQAADVTGVPGRYHHESASLACAHRLAAAAGGRRRRAQEREKMQKHSDESLVAYLDGELEADERAHVEAWIDADPEVRGRLLALAESANTLRTAFADFVAEPVPDRLHRRRVARRRPRPRSRNRRPAAAPRERGTTRIGALVHSAGDRWPVCSASSSAWVLDISAAAHSVR